MVLQILDKNYFLEIEKFIKSNFTENQIVIFSNLSSDNLPNLYRYAELYVFTSYCEVFGLTSLEAMSQKTPVVISNKSSLPEINGNAAIYFDPDDINEITNSLGQYLFEGKLKVKSGLNSFTLPLNGLLPGVYLLKLNGKLFKLIKNN